MGHRSRPTPTAHPGVHEATVQPAALVRAEPQTFGDPRTEPLDEHVGLRREPAYQLGAVGTADVDRDRTSTSVDDVVCSRATRSPCSGPVTPSPGRCR